VSRLLQDYLTAECGYGTDGTAQETRVVGV
jgi:hypothetical protein